MFIEKRLLIFAGFVLFAFGFGVGNMFTEDNDMSKGTLIVRQDGHQVALAKTGPDYAKVVNLTNVKDPGAYIAFPLYAEKSFEKVFS